MATISSIAHEKIVTLPPMTKKVLKYVVSLLLAGALVYFALKEIDWSAFVEGLKATRWGYIVLFFVVSILALIFREERWKAMMEPIDPEIKRIDAWDSSNVGNVLNIVLPGSGEFARCGYVVSKKLSYDKAFGTIVCERAWDVAAVVGLLLVAIALKWGTFGQFVIDNILNPAAGRSSALLWVVTGTVLLLLAGFFAAVYRYRSRVKLFGKIASAISGLWAGIKSFSQIRHKWAFVLYTIGIWVMYLLMSYFTFLALPSLEHLDFVDALFLSSVGNIASVIPVPGGIGAYHYLIALSLEGLYGATWEMGILYATLNHELHTVLIFVFGAISYLCLSLRRRKR